MTTSSYSSEDIQKEVCHNEQDPINSGEDESDISLYASMFMGVLISDESF